MLPRSFWQILRFFLFGDFSKWRGMSLILVLKSLTHLGFPIQGHLDVT